MCRRCSECQNSEHYWLEGYWRPDGDKSQDPIFGYVCKHCETVGDDCNDCGGDGCESCNGVGIVVVNGTPLDEDDDLFF